MSPQERDRLLAAHERRTPFAAAPGDTTVLHGCRSRQVRRLSTLPAVGSKGRA